jgi:hypothetical protein
VGTRSSFLVNSSKPARDGALTTVGFEYKLADSRSVLGKFGGEFPRPRRSSPAPARSAKCGGEPRAITRSEFSNCSLTFGKPTAASE